MKTEYICENCGFRGFPKSTIADYYSYINFYFSTLTKMISKVDLNFKVCPKCGKRAMKSTYVSQIEPMNSKFRWAIIILGTLFVLSALVLAALSGQME